MTRSWLLSFCLATGFLVSAWPSVLRADDLPAPSDRALRHSDVVFMYDNPDLYQTFGCTVLGWAGRADAEHIRRAHEKGVRLFSCSIGFLTEFRGVIDFTDDFLDAACRDFSGKPFVVPWLWDHKYKGQPAYWWCTNSPLYRRYLRSRLERVVAAEPDGLHIDDYRGTSGSITWLGGGFCRHCMAAFRKYLAENVPREKLAELGISDLKDFDYRQFLLDRGVKPEEYRRRRARLPLADEFYRFQVTAANRFVAEFHRLACQLRGRRLTLSVNSGLNSPHALVVAPHVSYFCCEVSHQASRLRPPDHPAYIYKLADGLNRPVASTASGPDWALINEQKRSGLVQTWVALSYAFGHNFMAPHRQWCYTRQKGTHWYTGPTEAYAPLYRFVRRTARLLDGYEAVAPVAVVYSNAARWKGKGNVEPICVELARRNVPFTVLIAGDDLLPYRLRLETLSRFRAVVVPKDVQLDAAQQKALDAVRSAGRLVVWPDVGRLEQLVGQPVRVESPEPVWAVVRTWVGGADGEGAKPASSHVAVNQSTGRLIPTAWTAGPPNQPRPLVVHLLNRAYDAKLDRVTPQRNVKVHLSRSLLAGRRVRAARLHQFDAEPETVWVSQDNAGVTLTVPRLGLWGVLELESDSPPQPMR